MKEVKDRFYFKSFVIGVICMVVFFAFGYGYSIWSIKNPHSYTEEEYVVQENDTLDSIVEQYRLLGKDILTMKTLIKKLNGITEDQLTPGTRILVPVRK